MEHRSKLLQNMLILGLRQSLEIASKQGSAVLASRFEDEFIPIHKLIKRLEELKHIHKTSLDRCDFDFIVDWLVEK